MTKPVNVYQWGKLNGEMFSFPMRNNTAVLTFVTLVNTVILDMLTRVIKQERKIKDFSK